MIKYEYSLFSTSIWTEILLYNTPVGTFYFINIAGQSNLMVFLTIQKDGSISRSYDLDL